MELLDYNKYFFIGIAGVGMSSIAQFLRKLGKQVSGSDRLKVLQPQLPIFKKFEAQGITVYKQGVGEIEPNSLVVVSTAIEKSVPEYKLAVSKGCKIVHRSDILNAIASQYKSIAVAGTAGKSTTAGMIYHILDKLGMKPNLINGASLISLMDERNTGSFAYNGGQWLIFEADESDGSLVKYHPQAGVLLNISHDHTDLHSLMNIFSQYVSNSEFVIGNCDDENIRQILINGRYICFCRNTNCQFRAQNVRTDWTGNKFEINGHEAELPLLGDHNVDNAVAALAVSAFLGLDLKSAINALSSFRGMYRRMQVIYRGINYTIIDDYAHNPAKIKSAIESVQKLSEQVIAWFQPHGFTPLKNFGDELVDTLSGIMRSNDVFVMSPVYYAGGTAPKDICARDYIDKLKARGIRAFFLEHKKALPDLIRQIAIPPTVVLLMGARDPLLDYFANFVSNFIIYYDQGI